MKQGFSFIEFMIALALASMILSVLFNAFFSINRVGMVTENVIQQDSSMFIIYHQMHKDLSAVTIPFINLIKHIGQSKKLEKEAKEKKKEEERDKETNKEELSVKPIKRIFVYSQQGMMMKEFSFITTNPLVVYQQAKNVQPKSRFLRVTYALVESSENKGMYSLYRKENMQLDEQTSEKGFLVVDNIKSLICKFSYPRFNKDTKNKNELIMTELKKTNRWQSDELMNELSKTVLVPQFITIELTVWDMRKQQEHSFSFECIVQAYSVIIDLLKGLSTIEEKEAAQTTKETDKKHDKVQVAKIKLPDIKQVRKSVNEMFKTMNQQKIS